MPGPMRRWDAGHEGSSCPRLARIPLEFIGEIVGLDAVARRLVVRERGVPWRERSFSVRDARIDRGPLRQSIDDLDGGECVRVRYTGEGILREAQRVEVVSDKRRDLARLGGIRRA